MTLIIHAPNIHQGGGRALLVPLLEAVTGPCIAILDARLHPLPAFPPAVRVMRVSPTLTGRLSAEWCLRQLAQVGDVVLCFGNLPPLFNNRGCVSVFLQNRYLFGRRDLSSFRWPVRLRLLAERFWLRFRLMKAMQVFVQAPTMAGELALVSGIRARVLPFFPVTSPCQTTSEQRRFDFIYVATGEPHKNHRNLVEAWKLLAKDGLFPSLCLTLDHERDRNLLTWVELQARTDHLLIENMGLITRQEIDRLYRASGALIYPSTLESFGLPLLEGAAAGLPILAAELDYVRDVSVPVQTFDPNSPVSMARAVKRHLGVAELPPPPLSPAAFLQIIQARGQ
ncbi:MAG: glycosyltransferase [Rhodocyclaceae bacterium]|nr:glycosyltransferase [Rhodocyclaceae bacterium]